MGREICARGTQENFNTHQVSDRTYVKVHKQSSDTTVRPAPTRTPTKTTPTQEQVKLKYGKITVTVKNAENVSVKEEDGQMVIKLLGK